MELLIVVFVAAICITAGIAGALYSLAWSICISVVCTLVLLRFRNTTGDENAYAIKWWAWCVLIVTWALFGAIKFFI